MLHARGSRWLLIFGTGAGFLWFACGSGGGGGSSGSGGSGGSSGSSLTGVVAKGRVGGATVKLFTMNSDGTRGAALGTSTTDASGAFTMVLEVSGPTLVEATGGAVELVKVNVDENPKIAQSFQSAFGLAFLVERNAHHDKDEAHQHQGFFQIAEQQINGATRDE